MKRKLAIILAFVMILNVFPASVFAGGVGRVDGGTDGTDAAAEAMYSDVTSEHWANGVISRWSGERYGVLMGDGLGHFFPDDSLSLGELATVLSKTFGYTERTRAAVTPKWADEYVEKAIAAGIIDGAARIDADTPVSREQAIMYLARAYHVAPVSGGSSFTDDSDIAAEYRPYVKAFQEAGYISGKAGGAFDPKAAYTRSEAIQVLDNTTGDILDTSASGMTYGKNVIIRGAGVTLEDTVVDGDLIIAQGVGDGDVHINNVTVKGDVYVSGGGTDSLYLANFRVEGSIIVRKYEGEDTVRIVVSGECNFSAIVLETGVILVTQELADGTLISVEISDEYLDGSKFEFVGAFDNIVNNGTGADITVTGSVNRLTLNESAAVHGTGRISTAVVSEKAGADTSFATRPTNVTGAGRNSVTMPAAPSSGGSGSSGGGGGSGSNPPDSTDRVVASAAVTPAAVTVEQGAAFTLPATATATLSGGGSHDFAVVWSPAAADTSVIGTFTFTGTLTMTAGYTNPNNVAVTLTLTVAPVLTKITLTPPAKLLYLTGEDLDLTGMSVMGTYSDGTEATVSPTEYTVSGYDGTAAGEQNITVAVKGLTDEFTVTVYNAVTEGTLVSITEPAAVTVANGAEHSAAGFNLPPRVEITVEVNVTETTTENVLTLADVNWGVDAAEYDPALKTEQTFDVTGAVALPTGVTDGGLPLDIIARVTVSAAVYTVTFNLNGQSGAAIAARRVSHGGTVAKPADPVSVSHNFVGWYAASDGSGDAWDFTADTVTGDTVLYAKWTIKTYTVTFAQGVPSEPAAQGIPAAITVEHGSAATQPATLPTLAGYSFAGWFKDAACTAVYDWAAPVTGGITLYAKFADVMDEALNALTFDTIRGANLNEQSITADLALITGMTDYQGLTIAWESSNPAVIATSGTVRRPAQTAADEQVTLTATLTLGGVSRTKQFMLVVRKQGTTGVEVTERDARFAPGYPIVTFDGEGKATLKVRLNPGVATETAPVVAYFAMEGWNVNDDRTFDKEGILFGHLVVKDRPGAVITLSHLASVDEIVIADDQEHVYTSDSSVLEDGRAFAAGVVLLKNDALDDPATVGGTVIRLSSEQISSGLDSTPPRFDAAVFNNAGNKLYAYFNERITNTALNPVDFTLANAGTVNVSSVAVGQSAEDYSGANMSWAVLTLSGPIAENNQGNVRLTYTPSGTNVIADASSNKVISPMTYNNVISAAQSINTVINPSEGALLVELFPAIWPQREIDISKIVLKKDGVPVALTRTARNYSTDGSSHWIYFTFEKDISVRANYTVEVAEGLTTYAESAFGPIVSQNVNRVLPAVNTRNMTATLSGRQIRLVLNGAGIAHYGGVPCCFILTVDGKQVLIREHADRLGNDETSVVIELNERRAAIVAAGSDVAISYDPNAHGHELTANFWLTDASGAYIPAFGPVTVANK